MVAVEHVQKVFEAKKTFEAYIDTGGTEAQRELGDDIDSTFGSYIENGAELHTNRKAPGTGTTIDNATLVRVRFQLLDLPEVQQLLVPSKALYPCRQNYNGLRVEEGERQEFKYCSALESTDEVRSVKHQIQCRHVEERTQVSTQNNC